MKEKNMEKKLINVHCLASHNFKHCLSNHNFKCFKKKFEEKLCVKLEEMY